MFDKSIAVQLPFSLKRDEIKEIINTKIQLDNFVFIVKGIEFPNVPEDTLKDFTLYLIKE